jgi:oligopeptide/dipeptide ABC transporter ATP-binding protein
MEEAFNPKLRRHFLETDEASTVADRGPMAVARPTPAEATASAPILSVRDLSVEFDSPSGPLRAVDGVSFDLRRGETLGLVGESGSGKTTTVMAMLRLLPPGGRVVGGSVSFDGVDVLALGADELRALRWSRLSIVFQGAMNALNPVRTVGDQIAEALRTHEPELTPREVNARVDELLRRVGIGPRRGREYPHTFSGGMRQRAMIALALACRPDVIIADEPTTALDVMIQAQILELLTGLAAELGMSTIIVTHDLGVVAQVCDRVVVMYGGQVAEDGDVAAIYGAPKHPYTRLLLNAFPNVADEDRTLRAIPGAPPRLDAMPAGCRFAPRCPFAFERCATEVPQPYLLPEGHRAACFLVETHG